MEEDLDLYEEPAETGNELPFERAKSRRFLETNRTAQAKDIIKKGGRWLLILSMLREPTRVTDIVKETGLPRSTVSRILKILRERGIVTAYRGIDGRNVYYELSKEGSNVYREISSIIRRRLKKCLRETKELDPECIVKILSKISEDVRVQSAILTIADVKRKGEAFVLY